MYALKILKAKGLTGRALNQVSNAYLVNRITYALPAWWGFTTSAERTKLQSVLNKASRWGLDGGIVFPTIELTAEAMQRKLFANILANPTHVLHHLLPPVKTVSYDLRPRPHNRVIPRCSTIEGKNFINRMLSF